MLSICGVFIEKFKCINWKFFIENGCEMLIFCLDRKLMIFIKLGGSLFNVVFVV